MSATSIEMLAESFRPLVRVYGDACSLEDFAKAQKAIADYDAAKAAPVEPHPHALMLIKENYRLQAEVERLTKRLEALTSDAAVAEASRVFSLTNWHISTISDGIINRAVPDTGTLKAAIAAARDSTLPFVPSAFATYQANEADGVH